MDVDIEGGTAGWLGTPLLLPESDPEINFPGPCPRAREAFIMPMPNKEMSRALAPVSAEPAVELPAAAAVFGSDCLFRPPRELGRVELPAG